MNPNNQSVEAWVQEALDRYEQPLIRYAATIMGDVERARDVVQDTFVRLCSADRATVDGKLAPWLYAVCRNRALDVRKKEGRMEALNNGHLETISSGAAGPVTLAARNETHSLILSTVDTLPENQREAFRLKFQDELTYREISEIMSVSLGTVSNLITAALNTVRTRLRAETDLAGEVQQ